MLLSIIWEEGCSMSFALRLSLCFLALTATFISPALTQSQSAPPATAAQHSADEAALRALAEAFFRAWAAKDLNDWLRLWSAQAPELEARKKATAELFTSSAKECSIHSRHLGRLGWR